MNAKMILWIEKDGVVKTLRQHMLAAGHSKNTGANLAKKYHCYQRDLKVRHLEPYLGSDIKIVPPPESKTKRGPRNKSRMTAETEKIKLGDVRKFFSAIKPVLTDNSWTYYGRA